MPKAALGLGMVVTGVGRASADEFANRSGASIEELRADYGFADYTNDLEAALREADFVAILAAATPETRGLVDRSSSG